MLSSALAAAGGMEEALRRELGTSVLRATGHLGGGCISQGQSYETDGGRVYVKSNSKPEVGRVLRVGCVWRAPGSARGLRGLLWERPLLGGGRRAWLDWASLWGGRLAGWPHAIADKQLESRRWPAAEVGDLLRLPACAHCCWSGM